MPTRTRPRPRPRRRPRRQRPPRSASGGSPALLVIIVLAVLALTFFGGALNWPILLYAPLVAPGVPPTLLVGLLWGLVGLGVYLVLRPR